MRTKALIISLLICVVKMNANIGYWRNDTSFIELRQCKSSKVFIEKKSKDISEKGAIANHKGLYERFYSNDSKRVSYKNDFVSNIYLSPLNDTIVFLPRISVKVNALSVLEMILAEMPNELKLLNQFKDGVARLECNVNTSEELLSLTNRLAHIKDVVWCEPAKLSNITFFNSLYSLQYYLKNTGQFNGSAGQDINVVNAWNITKGQPFITVAVIDNGVDKQHEDLSQVVSGFTTQSYSGTGAPITNDGHGTACAGIVGADDNSIGIIGVAPGVKILPINIEPDGFSGNDEISLAIRWAADRADVLSCSWGNNSSNDSPDIVSALRYARNYGRDGKGCVEVFAAGNYWGYNNISNVSFPARLDSVLAVGALDKNGNICSYSQRGSGLNIMAFGGNSDIVTTDISGSSGYAASNYTYTFGGTSAACPQVAGVAALMLSANPMLTEAQVRQYLQSTATDLGTSGFDNTYGYGKVNAYQAVNAVKLNVSISGSTIIHGTEIYTLNNLPDGFTVVWSASNGMTITQVSADMRECTLTRTSGTPSQFALFAEVYYQGVRIKRVYKAIYTQISSTYYQESCTYYNVSHPAINSHTLNQGQSTFVHMGCKVHVYSPALSGATVTHSGITPETWHYSGGNEITFSLPLGSGGQPFDIYINGDANNNDGHYLFFAAGNNGNLTSSSLQILPTMSGFEVIVRNNDEYSNLPKEKNSWSLEVYDTIQGKLVHNERVMGESKILSTNSWRSGTYVVRVLIDGNDDEPLVGKIQVK